MTTVLVVAVGLPACLALAIAAAPWSPQRAVRVATKAHQLGAATAAVLLAIVWADGPLELVLRTDGSAVVGLVADRSSALLVMLVTGVGAVVVTFAGRALIGDSSAAPFAGWASLLVAGTLVVATAATGSGLTLGWVVAGFALAKLVALPAGGPPAARAAHLVRRTFTIGDGALLAAFTATAVWAGDPDLTQPGAWGLDDERLALPFGLEIDAIDVIAVLLVIAGITRSALLPANRWLPATLAAPTPVSALLHAGVVNGAGVLLLRSAGVAGESSVALGLLFAGGVATAIVASAVMLVRPDVKGALAWSTSAQMGFMSVQIAIGAFTAALFHIVGHALYKATLFLGSGETAARHSRRRNLPAATRTTPGFSAVLIATLVPAGAIAAALVALDPHLNDAATVMVAVFGWSATAHGVSGWLTAAPAGAIASATAVAGAVLGPFVYVGGLTLFEKWLYASAPSDAARAIPAPWVLGTIAVTAAGLAVTAALIHRRPSARFRLHLALATLGRRPDPAHRQPRQQRKGSTASVASPSLTVVGDAASGGS